MLRTCVIFTAIAIMGCEGKTEEWLEAMKLDISMSPGLADDESIFPKCEPRSFAPVIELRKKEDKISLYYED